MSLTPYQSMWVAYYCTAETTGVERPLKPAEALTYYRILTDQQCFILRHKVIGNSPNSVRKFGYVLDPRHLLMLSPGWSMAQLAGVIEANSVPAGQSDAGLIGSKLSKAHELMDEAISLVASETKGQKSVKKVETAVHLAMTKTAMKKRGAKK